MGSPKPTPPKSKGKPEDKKDYVLSPHLMQRPFKDVLKDFFKNSNDKEQN